MRTASILIVEDEGVVAEDLQQSLIELGYDAFAIAVSADEAIQAATERCPDVVLMDIRIKGARDGVEAATIIREQFRVPVVFLTAHADEATLDRAKRVEPAGYLVKPVRPAELKSAIEVAVYRGEMERRLRERERWFSTTLESIADAVVTVDLAGRITFMNPEAEQLTGLSSRDVLGKPSREVIKLLDDPLGRAFSPLEQALAERRVVRVQEATMVNATTGTVRTVSDSAAPVVDRGTPLGAVMVFRDVTEQKKMQHRLELADRLSSLGTMAAGVAHEVNNPLSVIVANTELLQHGVAELLHKVPPEIREPLGELHALLADVATSGDRIARIVSDLRSFARPAPTSSGAADVAEALRWALKTTATEARHRARTTTRFGDVPLVRGDEGRLAQVFVNILLNAAQAIEAGSIEQNEVATSIELDPSGRVVVEIRDTGSGIPEDVRRRIFEPFFTTKPVGVGTGLGLSISHGILASMGGEIRIESEVGKGTLVRVLLQPAATAEPPVALVGDTVPQSTRARILAVDDEPMVLRAIQRMLRGHEVTVEQRAVDALGRIDRGEGFDVILSDLMMPEMSGQALYEALLERSPALASKVVFITGGAVTAQAEDFLKTVVNPWLEKPFDAATLSRVVSRVIDQVAPTSPTVRSS